MSFGDTVSRTLPLENTCATWDTGTLGHWDTSGPKRTAQQPIRIHFGLKPKVKEKEKTRKRKQGKVGGNQMEKSSLCVGSLGANMSSFVHLV